MINFGMILIASYCTDKRKLLQKKFVNYVKNVSRNASRHASSHASSLASRHDSSHASSHASRHDFSHASSHASRHYSRHEISRFKILSILTPTKSHLERLQSSLTASCENRHLDSYRKTQVVGKSKKDLILIFADLELQICKYPKPIFVKFLNWFWIFVDLKLQISICSSKSAKIQNQF